jgi:DNA repair exonuclease SbcCD nuclease subunit
MVGLRLALAASCVADGTIGKPDVNMDATTEVVLVHSSDLHVDDGVTADAHDGDGTAGLALVLATARAVRADIVLLAGDTFDHNRLPISVLQRAAALLRAADLPIVILPGNHDPAMPGSAHHRGGFGDIPQVHVLGVTHDDAVLLARWDLEIWGLAHRDYADMAPLAGPRPRRTRWQIVLAHGHYEPSLDPAKSLRPSWLFGDAAIAATGADYVALGHWNRAERVGNGVVPTYYSGSPELARTVNVVRLGGDGVAVRREPLG